MKKIFLTFILLSVYCLYAQPEINNGDLLAAQVKIESLTKQIVDLKSDNQTLRNNLKEKTDETLVQRVDKYLDSRNMWINILISGLGILVAIVGLLIPGLLYMQGIRLRNRVEDQYDKVKDQIKVIDKQVIKIEKSERKSADSAKFAEAERVYMEAYGYAQKKEYGKAIDYYSKVILILSDLDNIPETNLAYSYTNRALAYTKIGRLGPAIEDFNKAIEVNPNLAEIYDGRGTALTRKGEYVNGILDFNKAIELNPKDTGLFYNRVWAYFLSGDNEKVQKEFINLVEMDHDEWSNDNIPLLKLVINKKYPDATVLLNKMIKENIEFDKDIQKYLIKQKTK